MNIEPTSAYLPEIIDSQAILDTAKKDPDIQKIFGWDTRAGYKIQVNFGPGRSAIKDFKAIVTLWESGKFFHGGGDGQIYCCMDHRVFNNNPTVAPSALPILREM